MPLVQKLIDEFKIIWHAVIALVIASHVPACNDPPTFALDRISDRWKRLAKTSIINHRYRSSLYISWKVVIVVLPVTCEFIGSIHVQTN